MSQGRFDNLDPDDDPNEVNAVKWKRAYYLVVGPRGYLAVESRAKRHAFNDPVDKASGREPIFIAPDGALRDVVVEAAVRAAEQRGASTYDARDKARRLMDSVMFERSWGRRDFSKCSFCGGPTPCLRED